LLLERWESHSATSRQSFASSASGCEITKSLAVQLVAVQSLAVQLVAVQLVAVQLVANETGDFLGSLLQKMGGNLPSRTVSVR